MFIHGLSTICRVKANDLDGAGATVLFSMAAAVDNVCMVYKRSVNCLGLSGFV